MKEKMITRTISMTTITVLGVDEQTGETLSRSYTVPGKITDLAKALKLANKLNDDKLYHPAVVSEIANTDKLLGVTVSWFMENAVEVTRPESQTKTKKEA